MKVAAIIVLYLAFVIGVSVWATKHNSPQHVWFYCHMLHLCSED